MHDGGATTRQSDRPLHPATLSGAQPEIAAHLRTASSSWRITVERCTYGARSYRGAGIMPRSGWQQQVCLWRVFLAAHRTVDGSRRGRAGQQVLAIFTLCSLGSRAGCHSGRTCAHQMRQNLPQQAHSPSMSQTLPQLQSRAFWQACSAGKHTTIIRTSHQARCDVLTGKQHPAVRSQPRPCHTCTSE
jgi:hypothetical protein